MTIKGECWVCGSETDKGIALTPRRSYFLNVKEYRMMITLDVETNKLEIDWIKSQAEIAADHYRDTVNWLWRDDTDDY